MSENKLVDLDQGLVVDRDNEEFNDGKVIVARAFDEQGRMLHSPQDILTHYSDVTEAEENMPPISKWVAYKVAVRRFFAQLWFPIKRWKMRRILKNAPENFAPDPTSEVLASQGLPDQLTLKVVSIKDINDILKK